MGQLNTIISPCTIIILLAFSVPNTMPSDHKKHCAEVKCKDPPPNFKCTIIPENSKTSIPKPKGKPAECCPLWQCNEKSNPEKLNFYTFHGLLGGGTETVHYASSRTRKGEPIFDVVQSLATGNHDAVALAGDVGQNGEDVLKEMQESLKKLGLF